MHREIPIGNRKIAEWMEERRKEQEKRRLKDIKPATASRFDEPYFPHLRTNQKKAQMLENRLTEIEKENRILFEKMLAIVNKKPQHGRTSSVNTKPYTAANHVSRKKDLIKIAIENQGIAKRIRGQKSHLDVEKMEDEFLKTQARLISMCKKPVVLFDTKGHVKPSNVTVRSPWQSSTAASTRDETIRTLQTEKETLTTKESLPPLYVKSKGVPKD
eukprot:TRINITY_DN4571_c0_g1_i1.p3 TRINITY_DN4571_c0_g1~~TRINITY_DN4571_c0_g1_i1.p3  ORF type:complete len:216 (+),score=23.20 TRINITY_DN4571_c0_g1_i1:240-887(+)